MEDLVKETKEARMGLIRCECGEQPQFYNKNSQEYVCKSCQVKTCDECWIKADGNCYECFLELNVIKSEDIKKIIKKGSVSYDENCKIQGCSNAGWCYSQLIPELLERIETLERKVDGERY
jgi:hypothetical protein